MTTDNWQRRARIAERQVCLLRDVLSLTLARTPKPPRRYHNEVCYPTDEEADNAADFALAHTHALATQALDKVKGPQQ